MLTMFCLCVAHALAPPPHVRPASGATHSPQRYDLRPTELQAAVLKQEPGAALCEACLAFACSTTLIEVRPITDSLLAKERRVPARAIPAAALELEPDLGVSASARGNRSA